MDKIKQGYANARLDRVRNDSRIEFTFATVAGGVALNHMQTLPITQAQAQYLSSPRVLLDMCVQGSMAIEPCLLRNSSGEIAQYL
jgi:hypothetical protein